MLLFIALRHLLSSNLKNFNTSHVTVYRSWLPNKTWQSLISIHLMLLFIISFSHAFLLSLYISIHLMLLFIGRKPANACRTNPFQYISCYCLSIPINFPPLFSCISIHLMLLHMAHPNGRLCGAKRPKCEAERSSPL